MSADMTQILTLTALSLGLAVGVAIPAQAEIVDYGYGYGSGYYGQYGYPMPSVTLARDLTVGSIGADIQALEMFLAGRGFLTVPGNGIFTVYTRDAVARFQAANGISPASGYVGPLTRMYVNAYLGSGYQYQGSGYPYTYQYPYPYGYGGSYYDGFSCPRGTYPQHTGSVIGCLSGSGSSGSGSLSGSASLRNFRLDSTRTTVRPGDDGVEVARARFDVRGGDVRVERVDLRFEFSGNSNEADDRPWQVFDRVALIADGDRIADLSVNRSSAWNRDGSGYVLRLDDLDDYVVDEGDTADLRIELDVRSSVSGSDSSSRAVWEIAIADDGIRVIDGEDDSQTIGDEDEAVRITIRR